MKNPFLINVSSIATKPGARLDVDVKSELDGLETTGSHATGETPIAFAGHVEAIEGGLVVDGHVTGKWTGECRRCLGEAGGDIEASVREIYERTPTEGETYGIEGDYIDLEPMVREAAMLELPVAPLCRPDCAGLCSICGANCNETDCGHTNEVKDDRWAVLDQLKDLPDG